MSDFIFDARSFRRALGNFATGVTVITAQDKQGNKVGVTANSFNSVSLDPPLILWSIDKKAHSLEVFQTATHFAVNILAADQIELSNRFARPSEDKFKEIVVTEGEGGMLLLNDCSARFHCQQHQMIDAGDHYILIGQVLQFDDFGRNPLLYHQGAYSTVMPHPRLAKANEVSDNPAHVGEGRLSGNLYYLLTQAVRSYQADYQPKQLATGLRTSEARMLLVLDSGFTHTKAGLLKEVAMPVHEIDQAVDILVRKGLIQIDGEHIALTEKGKEEAKYLYVIAEEHEQQILNKYAAADIQQFKDMLSAMIA